MLEPHSGWRCVVLTPLSQIPQAWYEHGQYIYNRNCCVSIPFYWSYRRNSHEWTIAIKGGHHFKKARHPQSWFTSHRAVQGSCWTPYDQRAHCWDLQDGQCPLTPRWLTISSIMQCAHKCARTSFRLMLRGADTTLTAPTGLVRAWSVHLQSQLLCQHSILLIL